MIRFVIRTLGLLIVAGGFVALVIDGARTIANGALAFTPLGETAFKAFPASFPILQPAVERHVHPLLWDPVLLNLFLAPTFAVAFVVGFALLWLGRRKPEPIGFDTKS